MIYNKTTYEKYNLYKRLLDRWKYLPKHLITDVVDNSNVSEELLNRVRSKRVHDYIKEKRRENG